MDRESAPSPAATLPSISEVAPPVVAATPSLFAGSFLLPTGSTRPATAAPPAGTILGTPLPSAKRPQSTEQPPEAWAMQTDDDREPARDLRIESPRTEAQRAADEAEQELELLRKLRQLDKQRDRDDSASEELADELERRRQTGRDPVESDRDAEDAEGIKAEATEVGDDAIAAGSTKQQFEMEPKPIAMILPFGDYNPDAAAGEEVDDPCEYLCPRPGGCPPLTGDDAVQCPEEIPLPQTRTAMRAWEDKRYHWVASDLHYHPLYFQDAQLERYGQTYHPLVQPFASSGKFLTQTLALPYLAAIDPPCSCVTPLGYYRPGECAPALHSAVPIDGRSAFEAAIFYAGAILVAP